MDLFLAVKPTVLVVDDSPNNLSLIANLLHESYTVKAVNRGAKVFKVVSEEQPDLILLDIMMPDLDGYEVCRLLKADPFTRNIPIIFLTSRSEIESEELGMKLGAVDYITRPISPLILLSRVKAHFVDASTARTLRVSNEYLEFEVTKRSRQLEALQDVTILALASLAETRDADTGNHLKRTQHYMRVLANQLRTHPRFSDFLNADMVELLFKSAPLHDIGKVGIPDKILLKPGRYEPEEYEIMKNHPRLGRDALNNAQKMAGQNIEFLEVAKEIVYSHHEKWDGSGYPQGLVGDAIPISARLMALADVYDALVCRRVYKDGMTHAKAAKIIIEGRGKHFDPDVVDAFLAQSAEFQFIASSIADTDEELQKKADFMASTI
ncbi:MAG: two-component system response regulator [Rhodoferax sp.]|uniref:two-component system response regulator n=1 Tax=Rhodoferax sp. TaxID=50421 RepID=UPI0030192795